jgi:secreted trypsin-like serine protease
LKSSRILIYLVDDITTDENEDACQGDSGGPLVIRRGDNHATGDADIQVGVVSWVRNAL